MKAAILVGEQVLVESIGAVAQLVIELKAGVALLIGWAVEYFSTALKKPRLRPLKLPYARACSLRAAPGAAAAVGVRRRYSSDEAATPWSGSALSRLNPVSTKSR